MSAAREQAWAAYLTYMHRRHRATSTVEQYDWAVRGFWRWCDGRRPPVPWDQVDPETLEAWLDRPTSRRSNAKGERLSQASRAHYATLLGTAYRFFHADGWLEWNPLARAVPAAWPLPDPRDLTLGQVRRLLEHVHGNPRLVLLVMLAFCGGLRCSEIATLEVGDVDLERGELQVRYGKGGKRRGVPIAAELAPVLASHLALMRHAGLEDGRLVRNAVTGAPVGKGYVSRLLSGAMRDAGLQETGHGLRHAFAKRLLEADDGRMDTLRAVSRMLGHSSTTVTERIYLNGSDAGCRRAIGLLPTVRRPQ